MFGIGFPEMCLICAIALIVVGPDKLPELARSLAKGVMEMRKTMNQLKDSLTEEDDVLGEVKRELDSTARELEHQIRESSEPGATPQIEDKSGADDVDAVIEMRPWEVDAAAAPTPETPEQEPGQESHGLSTPDTEAAKNPDP
jgi:sec-independent protein translocase protein TatB